MSDRTFPLTNLLWLAVGSVVGVAATLWLKSAPTFPKLERFHFKKKEGQQEQKVVTREEWLKARRELLKEEKQMTRHYDHVIRLRQSLPWELVNKEYVFDTSDGTVSLRQLFKPQEGFYDLIVWHLMFPPEWENGCTWCTYWIDGFDAYVPHFVPNGRKVNVVVIARAPLEKLAPFAQRKGWKNVQVLSCYRNSFNLDFGVSPPPEELKAKTSHFANFGSGSKNVLPDHGGLSVFRLSSDGETVYHTYSVFERGFDNLAAGNALLDTLPHGREGFGPNKHLK